MPKIRNILIFLSVAAVFVLIYIYFIKPKSEEAPLVSSAPVPGPAVSPAAAPSASLAADKNRAVAQDFLALLLSVTSIKLDDSIFSDPAFASLRDSSITLVPDGNEGRVNPFAPIGVDAAETDSAETENTATDIPALPN